MSLPAQATEEGQERGRSEGGAEGKARRRRRGQTQALRQDGVGACGRRVLHEVLPPRGLRRRGRHRHAEGVPEVGLHSRQAARVHRPEAGHETGEEGAVFCVNGGRCCRGRLSLDSGTLLASRHRTPTWSTPVVYIYYFIFEYFSLDAHCLPL